MYGNTLAFVSHLLGIILGIACGCNALSRTSENTKLRQRAVVLENDTIYPGWSVRRLHGQLVHFLGPVANTREAHRRVAGLVVTSHKGEGVELEFGDPWQAHVHIPSIRAYDITDCFDECFTF